MFTEILNKFLSGRAMTSPENEKIKTLYLSPYFLDKDRLLKIQTALPSIDAMYKNYAEEKHFPGYAFGIMVDGTLVYSGCGGYANIEKKIPATTQTLFRIASVTKSFTAMAIVKLRDEGKLRLDDPVYLYIPEIRQQKLTQDSPDITIRDLLTHSAGFPKDDPWGDRNLNRTDEELLAIIKNGISFSHVPGTTYEYSNLTFALLGYIIKQVSGISCQKFIAEHIWKPIGMKQATWEFTEVPAEQLAHGYRRNNDCWEEEDLLHDGSFGAMGGIITSIESFSHYAALHQLAWPPRDDAELDANPLKRSSIREMQQPWRFNELDTSPILLAGQKCPTINAYGYGLRWLRDCNARIYVGHSGGLPGFGSNWLILPEYGIGVASFANITYANTEEINLQVLDTLIKNAQLEPRKLPPSTLLNDRQKDLLTLLPDWKNAETNSIFAENFFLDLSIDTLRKTTGDIFAKMGNITHIGQMIPENQLRGYFIIEGERTNAKISFTLTPQHPALIQQYQIEEMADRYQS